MKKLFLFIALAFFAMTTMAQTEHLTFKGIPIDGSLGNFITKLKNTGLSYLGQDDGVAIFEGDFAGHRECNIAVATYQPTGKVSMVIVLFPTQDDWVTLETSYNSLKEMLSQKYDEPDTVIEEFQGYQPDTNNSKMHKLTMDQCTWGALFTTDNGEIELSISKHNYLSGRIVLRYRDRINTDVVKQQAINDL